MKEHFVVRKFGRKASILLSFLCYHIIVPIDSIHRIEVRLKSSFPDARGLGLVKDITDLGITVVSSASVTDVYYLDRKSVV